MLKHWTIIIITIISFMMINFVKHNEINHLNELNPKVHFSLKHILVQFVVYPNEEDDNEKK